jgi:hypothetical protein
MAVTNLIAEIVSFAAAQQPQDIGGLADIFFNGTKFLLDRGMRCYMVFDIVYYFTFNAESI